MGGRKHDGIPEVDDRCWRNLGDFEATETSSTEGTYRLGACRLFASGYVVIGNEGLGSLNFIMTVRGKSHIASQLRYLPQEMHIHSRHIVGEGSNKESVRGNHRRSRQYIQIMT